MEAKEANVFGEFHRKLRGNIYLSLRKYCERCGMDPGNISRMERGKTPPPQNAETLSKMAGALELKERSEKRRNFFDLANLCAGRLPKDLCDNEELLRRLPLLLRTLSGQKLSDEKLKDLIELLRKA